MAPDPMPVSLSPLDEERFGIRTAKALGVTTANLPEVLRFCAENDVALLIARCAADDLPAAHAMERAGFLLMDTLVYWSRDLVHKPLPEQRTVPIRPARPEESTRIREIAAEAFRGYLGHYHADERLDNEKCDEVYADWAYRCCISREFADEVLVAEIAGRIAGFATVQLDSAEKSEIGLTATATEARRQGVHSSLMLGCLEWSQGQGAHTTIISTQIHNIAAQRSWAKAGLQPSFALYTFHKWFD